MGKFIALAEIHSHMESQQTHINQPFAVQCEGASCPDRTTYSMIPFANTTTHSFENPDGYQS